MQVTLNPEYLGVWSERPEMSHILRPCGAVATGAEKSVRVRTDALARRGGSVKTGGAFTHHALAPCGYVQKAGRTSSAGSPRETGIEHTRFTTLLRDEALLVTPWRKPRQ
ncbi:hypothetical protein AAFF_G00064640 [Aldrovandia affinis]|uniref:Uncharacterized protein n=1 Tax=Aldrovandia affinis TaxID=143900 RepID=A0AAD7T3V2_9TELE|nr:hypothetical protein AAFF_G00064640 [Aldrovandia affinis]